MPSKVRPVSSGKQGSTYGSIAGVGGSVNLAPAASADASETVAAGKSIGFSTAHDASHGSHMSSLLVANLSPSVLPSALPTEAGRQSPSASSAVSSEYSHGPTESDAALSETELDGGSSGKRAFSDVHGIQSRKIARSTGSGNVDVGWSSRPSSCDGQSTSGFESESDAGGINEEDEYGDEDADVLGRGDALADSAADDDDLVMEEALAAVMDTR